MNKPAWIALTMFILLWPILLVLYFWERQVGYIESVRTQSINADSYTRELLKLVFEQLTAIGRGTNDDTH